MTGNSLTSQGIYLSSDVDLVVFGINKEEFSADGFLALPTKSLGYEYYTVSYARPTVKTQFGIAATMDNTEVCDIQFVFITHIAVSICLLHAPCAIYCLI